MIDDSADGSDDVEIALSVKKVLWYRQRHVDKMVAPLNDLNAYIGSIPDSDQSGDYNSARVGEKRSFQNFIAAQLYDSGQSKSFVTDLLFGIKEYQGILRHALETSARD
jgi:hypothetical protein